MPTLNSRSVNRPGSFALLAVIAFALVGCDREPAITEVETPEAAAPPRVNVFAIGAEQPVVESALFFGKLEPHRQSSLGFGRGGRVETISVRIGESVAQGEKLAELSQPELLAQRTELQQKLQQLDQPPPAGQPRPPDFVTQRQSLQANLARVEAEIAKGIIFAPFDCRLADAMVNVGGLVGAQSPVLKVVEDAPPLVKITLPRHIADRLSRDDAVQLSIDDASLPATVFSKSPLEGPAGGTTALLQISEIPAELNWSFGQTVTAHFELTRNESGYWLPLSALQDDASGLWSILIAEPEGDSSDVVRVSRRAVELLELSGDWAMVRGNLAPGEPVIVNGAHRVVAGQVVEPHDASEEFAVPESPGADS